MHAKPSKASATPDAIALLTADHKAVKQLFKQFEAMKDADVQDEKADLVETICNELTIHAQIEEEIFYPAVREAIDDEALMDEADVEHDEAKALIHQLDSMNPGDDHYDAKVTVLGENIDHHVKEEEGEMFKKVRKADIDLAALGEAMATRQAELKKQNGMPEEGDETATAAKAANSGSRSTLHAKSARPASGR